MSPTRSPDRKMKFSVFLQGDCNYHVAGWRHPDAWADGGLSFPKYIEMAKTAERGLFDLMFSADALTGELPRRPEFALLKGRGNYLCLNKIHNGSAGEPGDDRPQEELFDAVAITALGRDVKRLTEWSSETETGDPEIDDPPLTASGPDRLQAGV